MLRFWFWNTINGCSSFLQFVFFVCMFSFFAFEQFDFYRFFDLFCVYWHFFVPFQEFLSRVDGVCLCICFRFRYFLDSSPDFVSYKSCYYSEVSSFSPLFWGNLNCFSRIFFFSLFCDFFENHSVKLDYYFWFVGFHFFLWDKCWKFPFNFELKFYFFIVFYFIEVAIMLSVQCDWLGSVSGTVACLCIL